MGDCGCIYTEYDNAVMLKDETIKAARKQHKCSECKRTINIGESYQYTVSEFEGMLDTYKTCSDCQSIIKVFFCNGYGFTAVKRDLWEHINEMNGEISADCILALTPGARSVVLDMIQKVFDDLNEED